MFVRKKYIVLASWTPFLAGAAQLAVQPAAQARRDRLNSHD